METVSFGTFPLSVAEEVVADLWRVVEEYAQPSPTLRCRFDRHENVQIDVEFDDRREADMIVRCWMVGRPDIGPAPLLGPAIYRRIYDLRW
jgi:hypothetical protein